MKTIQSGILFRSAEFDRASMDNEKRTIELSFSSELPVERWFGQEILDHDPSSVDLSRLNNGGALLLEHRTDSQIGVVEEAKIENKRGKARVRFGTGQLASEIYEDVKSGIRRLVSVGYRVRKMVTESVADGVETMRAMSWVPMELSIVAIPADPSVGINRTSNTDQTNLEPIEIFPLMRTLLNADPPNAAGGGTTTASTGPDLQVIRSEATRIERERWAAIQELASSKTAARLGARAQEMAANAIKENLSVDQFRQRLFDALSNPEPIQTPNRPATIGMEEKDIREFSLLRALRTSMQNIERPSARENCYEFEVSQQVSKNSGREARSFWIPQDVLQAQGFIPTDMATIERKLALAQLAGLTGTRADLVVGTASLGGNIRPSILAADRFIDLLRNRMMVARLGAQLLDGLVGDVPIPRQSGAGTVYWAASETASTTASNLTIDQITLTPKCATALQAYSKQLLLQSTPSIEQLVRNDLLQIIALAVDLAALHGTAANGQPRGIASVSGIGSVAGGTDGAAPTYANVVQLETEVAVDNADIGALAYLTNAKVRGKLKTIFTNSTYGEIPLWTGTPGQVMGMLNGYNAAVSNQVSSALTKGTSTTVASAIFFGNWSDLLIGQWGPGIDILLDPYTAAATRLYKMYADTFVDVQVRHPESFAAMLDALTA